MVNDYNLVDIHFHTKDSFDAYENNKGTPFNWNDLIQYENEIDDNDKIKMIVKTDHNILNFHDYIRDKDFLETKGIKYLPGIEINGKSKVHWIFILNDFDLIRVSGSKTVGDILDEKIQEYYSYTSITPPISERQNAQTDQKNIGLFIDVLNDLDIKFIAIPHLDKTGGWYDKMKKSKDEFELVLKYLNDNIISGFESKHQNEFLKTHIKQTEIHIEKVVEVVQNTDENNDDELKRRIEHLKFLKRFDRTISENNVSIVRGSDFHGQINDVKNGLIDYSKIKHQLFYMKSECTFEGLRFALLDQDSRTFNFDRLNMYSKNNGTWIKEIVYENKMNESKTLKFKDGINSIIGARGTGKSYLISAILGQAHDYSTSSIVEDINIKKIIYADDKEVDCLVKNSYDILFQKNKNGDTSSTQIHDILAKAPYDTGVFMKKIRDFSEQHTEIKSSMEIDSYFQTLNDAITLKMKLNDYIKEFTMDYSFFEEYNSYVAAAGQSAFWKGKFDALSSFLLINTQKKESDYTEINDIKNSLMNLIARIEKTKNFVELNQEPSKIIIDQYIESTNELVKLYNSANIKIDFNKTRITTANERIKAMTRSLGTKLTNEEKSFEEKISNLEVFVQKVFSMIRSFNETNEVLLIGKKDIVSNETIFEFEVNYDTYKIKTIEEINFDLINQEELNKIFNNYNKAISISEFKEIRHGNLNLELVEKIKSFHDKRRNSMLLEKPKLTKSIQIKLNESPYKDILKMSPGERSDLLLQMVMNQNTDRILILDQPEDDLDNETVYNTLLVKLRSLKLRRQIFVVTHNANICINADSDTITTCENSNGEFKLNIATMESTNTFKYSSINSCIEGRQIDIAVNILEGGKSALRKRVKAIGYKDLFFEERNEG